MDGCQPNFAARTLQVRNPLPVGASYNLATKVMAITFDDRIVSENIGLGQFFLEGVDLQRRQSTVGGTIVGRRVSWPTAGIIGLNVPPPRVDYLHTLGDITGVQGGVVQAFAGFPVTVI